MTARSRIPLRVAAVTAVAAVVGAAAGFPAAAATGDDVAVVNTETVQIYTSPTGEIESQRIYEQLALTGQGQVALQNPVSTEGLRNLDGFGGFEVRDGQQVAELTVDGEEHLRSVSDYTGELPLDVDVRYRLDGKVVAPADVVGEDGELEVEFTVKNVTAVPQEVSFPDGDGGTVTKSVEVPIPMVGSLSTTAPANFTDVRSTSANMAGDGQGGTKLSFTMTLFPPIGSDTARFGYTATITDGVVPKANVTALPVNPLESPTFANAANSYQGGATTGVELANGAAEIDANLLRLRDGAAELLAGLIKLRDGAVQLEAGLAGEAAPGAQRLAEGATALDEGLGQISSGSERLAAGTGDAYAGGNKLDAGAGQISDGLQSLLGGLQELHDGVAQLPETVTAQLQADPKFQQAMLGLQLASWQLSGDVTPGVGPTLLAGVNQIRDGLNAALTGPATAAGTIAQLKAALGQIRLACAGNLACQGGIDQVVAGVDGTMVPQLQTAVGGLGKVSLGLNNPQAAADCAAAKMDADPTNDCGIKQVLDALVVGLPAMVDQLTNQISGTLLAGIGESTSNCDPTATLLCGAGALADGAQQLSEGTEQLVAGLGKLDAGAGQLSDGAGQAADGSGRLADGANQLAEGLGEAAAGSGKLAAGLGQAADGAPKLVDGAERLSVEGMGKLVEAGRGTAQNYGEMYAVIEAGAERAQAEKMAYGAPEGAVGLVAYSYEIAGADGEGGRNVARGLGALAVLAMGAGAFGLRRRLG